MAEIATLLEGDVNNQISQMRENIKGLSTELPTSPDELGAAAYDVVSAGVEGTSNQLKVLEESAKLATGGLGSTEQAVDLMTTALNSFNFETSEAGRVANVFFKTVDEGKNTVAELSNFFGQVAPLAKQAGISFEEINAATAVMTRRTGNAQKAQRGLRQILNAMLKPGEDLNKLFKDIGVNSFPQLIERAGGFQRALQEVKDATGGNINSFAQAVGSSRALSSALLQVGEAGEEVQRIMQDMKTDTGALEQAVRQVNDTFESELQRTLNELESFQIEVGREALPQVRDLIDLIRSKRTKDAGSSLLDMGEMAQRGFGRIADGAETGINSVADFLEEFQRFTDTTGRGQIDIPDLDVFQTAVDAQRDRLESLSNQAEQTKANIRTMAESIKRSNDLTETETEKLNQQVQSRIRAINQIVEAVPTTGEVAQDLVEPTNASRLRNILTDLRNLSGEFQKNINQIGGTDTDFGPSIIGGFGLGQGIAQPILDGIKRGLDDFKGDVSALEGDFRSLFSDVSREQLAKKQFEAIRTAVQSKFGQAMLEREDIQKALAAGQWEQVAEDIKDKFDDFSKDMIDIGERVAQAGLFGGLFGGGERAPDVDLGGLLQGRRTLQKIGEGGPQGTRRRTNLEQIAERIKQGSKQGTKEGARQGVKEGEKEKQRFRSRRFGAVRAQNKQAARERVRRATQIRRQGQSVRMQAGARSRFGFNPGSGLASDDNEGFSRGLASDGAQSNVQGIGSRGRLNLSGQFAGFGGQIRRNRARQKRALGQAVGGSDNVRKAADKNTKKTAETLGVVQENFDRQTHLLRDLNDSLESIERRVDRIERSR